MSAAVLLLLLLCLLLLLLVAERVVEEISHCMLARHAEKVVVRSWHHPVAESESVEAGLQSLRER